MMFLFGIVAVTLSVSAFMVSAASTMLMFLSGIVAVFANGRGVVPGLLAVSVNLFHAVFMHDVTYGSDWFTTNAGIGWQGVFLVVMIIQLLCLAILLWKWAFPEETKEIHADNTVDMQS